MIEFRTSIGGDARQLAKEFNEPGSNDRNDLEDKGLYDVAKAIREILEACASHRLALIVTIVASGVRNPDNGSTSGSITWIAEPKGQGGK